MAVLPGLLRRSLPLSASELRSSTLAKAFSMPPMRCSRTAPCGLPWKTWKHGSRIHISGMQNRMDAYLCEYRIVAARSAAVAHPNSSHSHLPCLEGREGFLFPRTGAVSPGRARPAPPQRPVLCAARTRCRCRVRPGTHMPPEPSPWPCESPPALPRPLRGGELFIERTERPQHVALEGHGGQWNHGMRCNLGGIQRVVMVSVPIITSVMIA